MKELLIFVSSLFVLGYTFNFSCDLDNADRWFVADKDTFKWITKTTVESEIEQLKNESNLVQYYLWTVVNPLRPQILILDDIASLKESDFNSSNPTRIMAHGFQGSHKSEACTLIKDAYLKTGPHNVICIDYEKISHASFPTVRYGLPSIGNDLGAFINFLGQAGGMSKKDLVVVGFSLGAHVVGFAGKFLIKSNNSLPVIVALDPSSPLFNYEDCSSRLCQTDANFVESIQTSGEGIFGLFKPIGDGTYYPNGGGVQPGCGLDIIGICAHLRAYKYFAEAILYNDFPSKKCNTYFDANTNSDQCGEIDNSLKMGTMESYGRKGVFYVPVNSKFPYGNISSF